MALDPQVIDLLERVRRADRLRAAFSNTGVGPTRESADGQE